MRNHKIGFVTLNALVTKTFFEKNLFKYVTRRDLSGVPLKESCLSKTDYCRIKANKNISPYSRDLTIRKKNNGVYV